MFQSVFLSSQVAIKIIDKTQLNPNSLQKVSDHPVGEQTVNVPLSAISGEYPPGVSRLGFLHPTSKVHRIPWLYSISTSQIAHDALQCPGRYSAYDIITREIIAQKKCAFQTL